MLKKIARTIGVKSTVAGIIINGSKVLLEKRSKKIVIDRGKWCLPGGHIKHGETAEMSIKREIKEELGLNTINTRFLFYQNEILPKLHLHNIVLVFKVEVKGNIKPNWEVSEIRGFNKKEINKLDMAFKHKEILKRFFDKKV